MRNFGWVVVSGVLFASSLTTIRAQEPSAVVSEPSFKFSKVVQGAVIEHAFVLRNLGAGPLRIEGVTLTPPMTLGRTPAQIGPGQQVALEVKLDTSKLAGFFEGEIELRLNDPKQPAVNLSVAGSVVPLIQLSPMAAFFVAGPRGIGGQGAIEIINHDPEPLQISKLEYASERFTLALNTLEEGRRYRLVLSLNPGGPGGKATDRVLVHTSSRTRPVLKIAANTYLRERVYTFPDAVDLGAVRLAEVKANPERLAQTLMVYQLNGTDFGAKFSTDAPLSIRAERGPAGDRWQVTIAIDDKDLRPGPITGSIIIETTDREFRKLTVPVSGAILP